MIEYPSILLTFAAGFLSFFSPCVLPLIPSYLGILGGIAGKLGGEADTAGNHQNKKRFILLAATLFFVLGFTMVFIIFGIIISTTFLLVGGAAFYIRLAAGIIVIVLGVNYIFDFIAFLNYEKRFNIAKAGGQELNKQGDNNQGLLGGFIGAFLAGAAFGAGWTPCIGPILTGVLFLAGQSGMAGVAALYLALYSIALGLPFVFAALFFDRFLVTAKKIRGKLPLIKKISGCLLIIIGILIITNRFSEMNIALQNWQFQFIDWAEDQALPFRVLANWLNLIKL